MGYVARSAARGAGAAAWLATAGCLAPTAIGLRHDGFIGVPGTIQGGVAVSTGETATVDATASVTVRPDVQVAAAVGTALFGTRAEAEVRLGGTAAVNEPSMSVSLGGGAWFAGDESTYGVHTRLVVARPVVPRVRTYGGLAINAVVDPVCAPPLLYETVCGVAMYGEPTIGASYRRIGARGWTQAVGVEVGATVVLAHAGRYDHVFGPTWVTPLLLAWFEVGRTPARPVPQPPPRD